MNNKRSRRLRRAAIALAGITESLLFNERLSKTHYIYRAAYPKDSPRAIYKKLKYNYTRSIYYGA